MKNKQEEICENCGLTEDDHNRIYCKYCGSKLKKDNVGYYCTTNSCSWFKGGPCKKFKPVHSPQEKSFSARCERSQGGVCLKSSTNQQVINPLAKRSPVPEDTSKENQGSPKEETLSEKEMKIFNENGFYTKDVKEFIKKLKATLEVNRKEDANLVIDKLAGERLLEEQKYE